MRLVLEPQERDPESSDENASPPAGAVETGFGGEGAAGVIGRDEWFEEPRVDNNEKPSYWGLLSVLPSDVDPSLCGVIGLLDMGADEFQRSANASDIIVKGVL